MVGVDPSWRVRGDGVDLHAVEVGALGAPAIVIAHGVGSSASFVIGCFAAAAYEAGLRLIAYDARGHGPRGRLRDPARHDLDAYIADLDAVVARAGARMVGGMSLGAHTAAAWAAGRTDLEGVLLCMPGWTGSAQPGVGPHAAVAADVRRVGVEAVLRAALADPGVPPWLAHLLDRDWRSSDAASLAAALVALDGGGAPTTAELATIAAPAGVVGWEGDGGHPLEVAVEWAQAVPRASLARIDMEEFGADPSVMGRAAMAAWATARQSPGSPPVGSGAGG